MCETLTVPVLPPGFVPCPVCREFTESDPNCPCHGMRAILVREPVRTLTRTEKENDRAVVFNQGH